MQSNDAVILIDCWTGYLGPVDLRTQMYHNICESIIEICPKLIVLATYGSNEIFNQQLKYNNKWVSTFWEYFPNFDSPVGLVKANQNLTHDIIFQFEVNCKQIALTKFWQLEHVLNQMKLAEDLNRVWYFGLYWNQCIRDREIGWVNFKEYCKNRNRDIDIMFKDNCTLKIPFEIDDTIECWPFIDEDTMTLTKKVRNHTYKLLQNSL